VIGVNTYRIAEEDPLEVLRVDNNEVYQQQVAKLERLRAERDETTYSGRWRPSRSRPGTGRPRARSTATCSRSPSDAARAKATVGEISDALEKVYGRHQGVIRTISGVFRDESAESGSTPAPAGARRDRRVRGGRGPAAPDPGRQDGPGRPRPRPEGRGQRVRRHGLRRRRGPAVSTPEEVAQQAIDADVHIVGVSSLGAGHLTLLPGAQAGAGRPGPLRTSWSWSVA
jgi:methylmalonyl-CoA mutase